MPVKANRFVDANGTEGLRKRWSTDPLEPRVDSRGNDFADRLGDASRVDERMVYAVPREVIEGGLGQGADDSPRQIGTGFSPGPPQGEYSA